MAAFGNKRRISRSGFCVVQCRPNHALQPTVRAFGAPVGANDAHLPRALRVLGAAEL
jgi:hypothetical protein